MKEVEKIQFYKQYGGEQKPTRQQMSLRFPVNYDRLLQLNKLNICVRQLRKQNSLTMRLHNDTDKTNVIKCKKILGVIKDQFLCVKKA